MDPLHSINPDAPIRAQPLDTNVPGQLDADHPLRAICTQWMAKIEMAGELKEKQFARDARDCMKFFNGPYDFMYSGSYMGSSLGMSMDAGEAAAMSDMAAPTFKMSLNKVAEGVQLFGPVLYHRNPERKVAPRKLPELPFGMMSALQIDPNSQQAVGQQEMMMQQQQQQAQQMDNARAGLLEWYLNYTPQELNLKDESRMAIDEAMIKGAGIMWTEAYTPKGSPIKLIGSFYDTYDNFFIDPDAERLEDAKWVARKCTHPVWQVEQEYGLAPGTLKAQTESSGQQASVNATADGDYNRRRGLTNDQFTYYKVYSKMGIGGRLSGAQKATRDVLDQFGEFCYLVVAAGTPFLLNLPNEVTNAQGNDQDLLKRLEWPTPFWMDDEWPCAELAFHRAPRQLYPISHFKPAMGELKALNWVYSFVISNIQVASRTFVAMKSTIGDKIKAALKSGGNFTVLEMEATSDSNNINELIQFLQHPSMNGDIWKVVESISENFDKRTGLSELMYGMSSRQIRSAQEANIKSDAISVRPDDMANKVEDWASKLAKLEAMAIRWHMTGQDIAPLMGPSAAYYWDQLITKSDPYSVTHQLQYTIEAGSTRKPNRERDAANVTQAIQTFLPFFTQYGMTTGNFGPVNAMTAAWAKVNGDDPTKFFIPNIQPPAPPPPEGNPQDKPPEGQ